jgi:DNA polymerase III subunit alpha, Gram-positive type
MIENNTPISETTFVFFDVETTGLSSRYGDEICEFGAARVVGGEVVDSLETLINPGRSISRDASVINGITDEMVKDSPMFDQVYPSMIEIFSDAVLVAHNAKFDIGFLSASFKKFGSTPLENIILDNLRLSRKLNPYIRSHSLANLKREFGIRTDRSHRALDDAKALATIFDQYTRAMHQKGTTTIGHLLDLHGAPVRFR